MIIGIILVIFFLSLIVLIHELGHFLTAKKFGVFVEEFGINLPPRIWGKKIGDTIYSINALPFGGFVKILGENGDEEALLPEEKKVADSIETSEEIIVSENSIEIKEEILAVHSEEPNKKYFFNLPIWKRTIILSAGVFLNFIFGWFLISTVFMVGVPESILITGVAKNSPAETAGILSGDKIISAKTDVQNIPENFKSKDFVAFVDQNKGKEITFKIERKKEQKEIIAIPRVSPPQGEGALGVSLMESGFNKLPFFQSLGQGFLTSIQIIKDVYVSIFELVKNVFIGKAAFNQVTGPVGIVRTASETSGLGIIYLIQLLAMISLNLAALNFFPFPALDGGRILFLIVEKIKGSALPKKFEIYANAAGMLILLSLMIVITIKDVLNLF